MGKFQIGETYPSREDDGAGYRQYTYVARGFVGANFEGGKTGRKEVLVLTFHDDDIGTRIWMVEPSGRLHGDMEGPYDMVLHEEMNQYTDNRHNIVEFLSCSTEEAERLEAKGGST